MEKVTEALAVIEDINAAYGIPTKVLAELRAEMADAKVCTPIIGKFSTGKSALVNTLLGYSRKLLKEDITPETAVPTEILYAEEEDSAAMLRNDGTLQRLSLEEYRSLEADASAVKSVRLCLRNSFLREIIRARNASVSN